jgi:hypothetical protein
LGFSSYGQGFKSLFTNVYDTNYIESYKKQLTTRLYTSRKYTDFKMRDREKNATLNYHPNDRLNLGFGATYRAITLNIGINFPFINKDDEKYGKTDYLDLQSHMLFRKLTIEFYLSFFKGYHIANPHSILLNYDETGVFPQRRDLLTINGGITAYYIFNNKKFSYRAAFNQDERQKKSAGTFLAGPAIFSNYIEGDSSLIPNNVFPEDFFDYYQLKRGRYTKALICAGYAHNFIVKEKIFFTLSLITGFGGGFMKIYSEENDIESLNNIDVSLTYTFRSAVGYNSKRFFVGASYINTSLHNPTPIGKTKFVFNAGNIRFNIAYRIPFKLGDELVEKIKKQ